MRPNSHRQKQERELTDLLQQMRTVPPRRAEAASLSRAQFLAQVDARQRGTLPVKRMNALQHLKENLDMLSPHMRRALSVGITALVLVSLLAGGTGVTTVAARSLPGDTLYPIKTGVEQTRVSLTRQAAERVVLNMSFAGDRLEEISRLIASGRADELHLATHQYEAYIQRALAALAEVDDAAAAQALTAQITASLSGYATALADISAGLPDKQRAPLDNAIAYSVSTGTFSGDFDFRGTVERIEPAQWVISGHAFQVTAGSQITAGIRVGDLVEVLARVGQSGSFVLRSVSLASAEPRLDPTPYPTLTPLSRTNDDDDFEFMGTVEQIRATEWVVAGHTLRITAGTEIEHPIAVGDRVEVEVRIEAAGVLTALEIERTDNGVADDGDEDIDDEDIDDDDTGDDDIDEVDDVADDDVADDDSDDDVTDDDSDDDVSDDDSDDDVTDDDSDDSEDDDDSADDDGSDD